MTAAPQSLPTMFLLAAEAALISGGHDHGTPDRLRDAAQLVAPVLTLDNLLSRKRELSAAAIDYIEARGRTVDDETIGFVSSGVEVGLVAGFLIAQMLDTRGR